MPALRTRLFLCTLGLLAIGATGAIAANWPQWRGPNGDGISDETGLPVQWSETAGVLWKLPLPGPGASTPAIWGDAVFLTTMQGDKLLALKVSKSKGEIEWSREVGTGTMRRGSPKRKEHTFHNLHNLASPSPVTDGEVVLFHFGTGDLVAFDFAGKELWRRNLQKEHGNYTIWWGHANSPVIWKDMVISVCMQDPLDDLQKDPAPSYVVAHDRKTGEQKWKVMRMTGSKAEDADAYTTPIFRQVDGKTEMIVVGGNQIDAYDPANGKRLWFLPGLRGSRTITGPTLADGLLYTTEGKRGALLAVKPGGTAKLGNDAILWKQSDSTPDTPCPVLWKGLVFTVADNGIALCRDAKTGALKWKERLLGDFKSSPLAADGKVYFLNMDGRCTVVAATDKFDKLAENRVDDGTPASLAIADGRIYLRGKKALYCIGKK
jgi:outer membrane protein assembly factor BamB